MQGAGGRVGRMVDGRHGRRPRGGGVRGRRVRRGRGRVRQLLPQGTGRSELSWTYLGYADDTPEQRRVRLKQSNLVGPAGFISMEDGAVGGFVQRGVAGAREFAAVVEMGGDNARGGEGRAPEASVRGFWKAWRGHMGV